MSNHDFSDQPPDAPSSIQHLNTVPQREHGVLMLPREQEHPHSQGDIVLEAARQHFPPHYHFDQGMQSEEYPRPQTHQVLVPTSCYQHLALQSLRGPWVTERQKAKITSDSNHKVQVNQFC